MSKDGHLLRFDVFDGRQDPGPDRVDRLLPTYGPMSPVMELANIRDGPEALRLIGSWFMWAERIRRATMETDPPHGRTYLFIQIQNILMATMAQGRSRRNTQVLEALIAAHRDELDGGGYGDLVPTSRPKGDDGNAVQRGKRRFSQQKDDHLRDFDRQVGEQL